jgi:hypothetical protein
MPHPLRSLFLRFPILIAPSCARKDISFLIAEALRGDGEAMAAAAGVLAGGYYAHFCGSGGLGREVAEGTVVDRVHSSIRNEILEDVVVSSFGKRRAMREKKFEDVWTRADSVNLHHHHQLQSICGASFISLKWEG